ncbi:tripartite tricarboxylate transporter TctB family protein [Bordetella genomosp. 13]|uniref:tripartite tricarboxylate transporter TctB family protein n=1 Tax=Bordetella genomosp. 13 TaxID=463040 RepID=UPI0016424B56|nr:tripartite tricarboxylate transporter TctB family protein [Bordetella genomosp. 13]
MQQAASFKKDYYGGALMVLIGLSAIYAAFNYHIGSLSHMGPGFFPASIGGLLAFTGLLIAASARGQKQKAAAKEGGEEAPLHAHPTDFPDLRGAVCIIGGTLAFLLFGEYGGLLPATFFAVFICGLGDRTNTIKQVLLLSVAMCVIATVVFWWALQLQLPLFTWG